MLYVLDYMLSSVTKDLHLQAGMNFVFFFMVFEVCLLIEFQATQICTAVLCLKF